MTNDCPLCKQGDSFVNVQCWHCWETVHMHECQIGDSECGDVIVAKCTECMEKLAFEVRCDGLEPMPDFKIPPLSEMNDMRVYTKP